MKLLKVNEHSFGGWLQTPHPTKSTHEITLWMGSKASIANMYVTPKPTKNYSYTSIPKSNVYKYTLTQNPPAS